MSTLWRRRRTPASLYIEKDTISKKVSFFILFVDLRSTRVADQYRQDLARDVAGIGLRCKENVSWCYFFRLCGPFHWRIGAMFRYVFSLFIGNIQRRPYRARRNTISSNSLFDKTLSQRPSGRMDSVFCRFSGSIHLSYYIPLRCARPCVPVLTYICSFRLYFWAYLPL